MIFRKLKKKFRNFELAEIPYFILKVISRFYLNLFLRIKKYKKKHFTSWLNGVVTNDDYANVDECTASSTGSTLIGSGTVKTCCNQTNLCNAYGNQSLPIGTTVKIPIVPSSASQFDCTLGAFMLSTLYALLISLIF